MKRLLCYTRQPIDEYYYDPKLAYSMHLAIEENGIFQSLNHNSGVLFAKATENEDGSLNPKSLRNPYLFAAKDGSFGVIAVRVSGDGEEDTESIGSVILFTSIDLLEYEEKGLVRLSNEVISEVTCEYIMEKGNYKISWCNTANEWFETEIETLKPYNKVLSSATTKSMSCTEISTEIEGAVPGNIIDIPDKTARRLVQKLTVPYHVKTVADSKIEAHSQEELEAVRAKAVYSDGTVALKRVDWDLSQIDWSQSGTYEVNGKLHQDHFEFPVAFNRADPCITYWNGRYYFIATNDADQNHTLYVREANSISGLVEAQEQLILDSDTYEQVGNLLWAPEFHEINGKLYIFLALTSGEFFHEESHIMELREGGNPACKADWSEPKRIVRADGNELCEAGQTITLDMTCFFWEGDYYVVWSQRQFLPKDLGAWLYIAKLNPEKPWELLSEPVVLSKPDYGWANNHTFVDEGPFALPQENRLILTFSSAAVDTSYVVGLLTIERGKELLVRENWKKGNYPILTSRSVKNEFGTGHNAYVKDEYGDIWNTYHARPGIKGVRSSGIRRVHFDVDGLPVLDLVEEKDVVESLSRVNAQVIVK